MRRAYELYNGLKNKKTWDQAAVLYAVRGLDGTRSAIFRRVEFPSALPFIFHLQLSWTDSRIER